MAGKILVVDDDAANRELLQETLIAEGMEVVTAPDGRSSLEEFARLKPDLVLLDVNMPFLHGFEECRLLKSNPETRLTAVVLVTRLLFNRRHTSKPSTKGMLTSSNTKSD